MTLAEARRLAPLLEARGVLTNAGTDRLDRSVPALRRSHGPRVITGFWPSGRAAAIVCVDTAEALARDGYSLRALRTCSLFPVTETVEAAA